MGDTYAAFHTVAGGSSREGCAACSQQELVVVSPLEALAMGAVAGQLAARAGGGG